MKQTIKPHLYIIVYLIVIQIAYSQVVYDYNSAESYKNPDFLKNSDPSKWDTKKVDWTNQAIFDNPKVYERYFIYGTPQVYANQNFYKNLPQDKYSELNYKMVQFDKIDDHSKIDANKYLKDYGCKLCFFSKEQKKCEPEGSCLKPALDRNIVKFSKEGIQHKGGDFVSIPGPYAGLQVHFKVTEQNIIMETFSKNRFKIPETDSLTLEAYKNKVTYAGKDMDLSYGNFVFKNGEVYVKKDSLGELYGVKIIPIKNDVKLFFDGQEHAECKCTYVSMDKDKKTVVIGAIESDPQVVKFKGSNQIVKLQGPLEIRQKFGTITVQNREDKGLIPEITMKFDTNQKYSIPNIITDGNAEIQVYGKNSITQLKSFTIGEDDKRIETKSNPLVLTITDNNGQSVLGTKQDPKKIIIGENNEMSTLSFNAISTQEPIAFYFKSVDDVKTELEKAKAADNRIKELQDATKAKWGNPGMRIFGYLDESREAPIVRALRNGCGSASISIDFCTSVAFNEGLNLFIDDYFYDNPKSSVSGFGNLGLDNFGSEAEGLKKMGYLRKDFEGFKAYDTTNEHNQKVKSANFDNIDVAVEALGARLKYTQDLVKRDAAKFGYKLDQDQFDYWTYVYWNCGPGCKTQQLKSGPQIPSKPGVIGGGDPIGNSKRVLATRDLIRQAGIFDKTLSQQIAKK